jgi:hypothetical protein
MKTSYHNNNSFLQKVDSLPTGPDWTCEMVAVVGNRASGDGGMMSEEVELWRRDPVECVKELIGNPAFREVMSYVPERANADRAGKNRIWDEMWTADW